MEVTEIYKDLKTHIHEVDLSEIDDLDVVCKTVISKYVHNPDSSNSSSLIKLQAVLDRVYEKINIGEWANTKTHLRKTMTLASYLKLLNTLKCSESPVITNELLEKLFKIIDNGLVFGCPLHKEPQLLQICASKLNKFNELVIDTNLPSVDKDIENNSGNIANKDMKEIEIIDCPSMETFYTKYIVKSQPVILDGCMKEWPALNKWKDQNYLLKLAGLRTVPIELGNKYTDEDWGQGLVTLKQFIEKYIYDTNNTMKGYLAQYQLFNQIPELREDISVPEYCYFSETQEEVDINAWYGPKGTVSPLHYDPKKNLLAQVIGEKSIYLFNPADAQYLYPYEDTLLTNTARVDPRICDYERFPEHQKASPFHCILKPGQMLFIPPKWWHFVESMSISFSVSFWWS